jgi:alkaline phosphatase
MSIRRPSAAPAIAAIIALSGVAAAQQNQIQQASTPLGAARNVIFFVGDGMGVSTVTATRIYSVGLEGELVVDQFPFTALSRTYTSDAITPDSAGTMSAMMSGVNTNSGVIGFGPDTERNDFNADGDGERTATLLEMAKEAGMRVGVVSTARLTHATPAACFSHVNDRDKENDIALQALPSDATYNPRLGAGVDLLMGGGRQFFVPAGVMDEEGGAGSRPDGRDLRAEYQDAGYRYIWDQAGFDALAPADLPVLGLFERSHMEYEYDRPADVGGEPSVAEMTSKAIELLSAATAGADRGYFLHVESGRIDHAHHAGNAWRSLMDAEALDQAVGEAVRAVDLRDTLIIVTADHSHVFNIAGYPLRAASELPYTPKSAPAEYLDSPFNNIFDVVYSISANGDISAAGDSSGVPYTTLGYLNGPGYRAGARVDPRSEPVGPNDPEYLQEAAVPLGSETHSGEEVAIYAIGRGAGNFRGTVKNTYIFEVMKSVLGL